MANTGTGVTGMRMVLALALAALVGGACGCGSHEAQAEGAKETAACVTGSYLMQEGSGTRSLWTFAADGTFLGTSSAQPLLRFSDHHGSWKVVNDNEIHATFLDFSFDAQGALTNIARVDSTLTIDGACQKLNGSFTVRFFEQGEDPFSPASDSGTPLTDTTSGQKIVAQ
jgi:hypothetical protein